MFKSILALIFGKALGNGDACKVGCFFFIIFFIFFYIGEWLIKTKLFPVHVKQIFLYIYMFILVAFALLIIYFFIKDLWNNREK